MYEVEALLGRKRSRGKQIDGTRKGTWMYLVKWKGWDGHEQAQTWEDAKRIENSLIEEYEDAQGSAHSSDEPDSKRPAPRAHPTRAQLGRKQDKKKRTLMSDDSSSESG